MKKKKEKGEERGDQIETITAIISKLYLGVGE